MPLQNAAAALQTLSNDPVAIGQSLAQGLNATAAAVAQGLAASGLTPLQVAKYLVNGTNASPLMTAKILKASGATATQSADALTQLFDPLGVLMGAVD